MIHLSFYYFENFFLLIKDDPAYLILGVVIQNVPILRINIKINILFEIRIKHSDMEIAMKFDSE